MATLEIWYALVCGLTIGVGGTVRGPASVLVVVEVDARAGGG